jgi:uncharacterized repeat protein (TIGR03837 family)
LAADLGGRGAQVRLWVDDASALRWMAPQGAVGVQVGAWVDARLEHVEPGAVVIEAFGCELPQAWLARMRRKAPVWINLEYLSAEAFVERVHKLASPQLSGPAAGLRKWFFYPGFTPATGGLLREADVLTRQQQFDRHAWLAGLKVVLRPHEQVVSLFCYEQPALAALLAHWAAHEAPTLLLVTPGHAARQVQALWGDTLHSGNLRVVQLPALTQWDYDHLLWASDVNFVRGEDSFVRAQWAGKPLVWQIYPQDDGAHVQKLDAFLQRYLAGVDGQLADGVMQLWRGWNGVHPRANPVPLANAWWQEHALAWRQNLVGQADLCTQLVQFVDQISSSEG